MKSPYRERAIEDPLHHGTALLKFISPNNVGLTGSHECGFYLRISVWQMYTPHAPVKGRNDKHPVSNHVQCDEIWSFVQKKEGNKARLKRTPRRIGDAYTFFGIERTRS
jgi:hypothetical protein